MSDARQPKFSHSFSPGRCLINFEKSSRVSRWQELDVTRASSSAMLPGAFPPDTLTCFVRTPFSVSARVLAAVFKAGMVSFHTKHQCSLLM
jgi:hypothetical protein